MGRQPSRGVPMYDFAKFSQKLHEIERIWTRGEGQSYVPETKAMVFLQPKERVGCGWAMAAPYPPLFN